MTVSKKEHFVNLIFFLYFFLSFFVLFSFPFTLYFSFLLCFFPCSYFSLFLSFSFDFVGNSGCFRLGHQLRHWRACIKRMHLDVHPRSIIFLPMCVYFRPVYRYFQPHGEYSRRLVLTSVKPTGYLTGRYLRKADIKYIHSCGV